MRNFKNFKFVIESEENKEIKATVFIKSKEVASGFWRTVNKNEARNKAFDFINGDTKSRPWNIAK